MRVLWRYPGHQKLAAVAFSKNRAFAALAHSRLVAVDSNDGSEHWRVRIPNTWGWMALSHDTLLYLAQHSRLAAFDVQEGALRWSRDLQGIFGWLHAAGRYLVVGGWRGYTDIICLSVASGETIWTYPAKGRQFHSTTVLGDGDHLIIADAEQSCVRSVALASGRETDAIQLEPEWFSVQPDRIPAASSGSWKGLPGALYLSRETRELMRVKVAPLRAEIFSVPEKPEAVAPPLDGACVFVGASRSLWRMQSEGEAWINHGPIAHFNRKTSLPAVILGNGRTVIGTSEGLLYRFDSTDGRVESRLRVGKRITEELALSCGNVCVATESGEIIGVKA